MHLTLQFSGGAEALVGNKREHRAELSDDKQWTVEKLLQWILENLLRDCDRPELLIVDGTVRPGILVLVNDTDWEILDGLKADLRDGDTVTFISTLHGG
ncbi:ubiquitin-related modifier 1 isoform 1 [Aphelenchoides avenae]|nr:ubiquitin-related modifier 1 isoform 1 [Aphelenchus avenae]